MNTIAEKNFAILKDRHPDTYSLISRLESIDDIETVEARNGDMVPLFTGGGKKIVVHSKFDPVKEAERFIGEVNPENFDLFIVFGFGFAFHIEALMKRLHKNGICLVVEKNASMIMGALQNRDLSALLNDERFLMLVEPSEDDISSILKGKSSQKVNFITHRGSHQIDPAYYSNSLELAKSYVSTKDVNIATLAKFEKIWSSNIARNIINVVQSRGANLFFNRFSGMPAIVAAAGPSLLDSLDFIRQNIDRSVVVAVDTSYGILLKNGIEPHFCLSVDPQVVNARYFEGVGKTNTVLVAEPVVHPSVFQLFKGRIVTTGFAFDMMKWIDRIVGERGELTHGGSVSTNAYDFARRLGASPVLMVGQDLAFTGGYAHARGSYLDEQIHLRTNRLSNVEMFNRFQLTALPKLFVKGIDGTKVHTNQKMMIFLNWFEKRKDPSLINATCGGAYIPGVNHKSMGDLNFEKTECSARQLIEDILESADKDEDFSAVKERLIKRLNIMVDEVDSLVPSIEKAIGLSDSLMELLSGPNKDKNKLGYLLKKLAETDSLVESKKNIKDFISFSIQRVIHTITEGYEIDEKDGALSEEELVAKRSVYLYKGMLEGALFNRKIFAKMIMLLS